MENPGIKCSIPDAIIKQQKNRAVSFTAGSPIPSNTAAACLRAASLAPPRGIGRESPAGDADARGESGLRVIQ